MRSRYTETILLVGCWFLAMLFVGCIHIHLIGGRSQTTTIYRSDDNLTESAMEAPSQISDSINPKIPIDRIQVGPDAIRGDGGGTPAPDTDPPVPDKPEGPDEPDEPEGPPAPAEPGAADRIFLWKPESESDGKLVVLLPWCLKAASVAAQNHHGEWVLGTLAGLSNTIRETWRFGHAGRAWTNPNVPVRVVTIDGEVLTWIVPAGAQRYDKDYDCE